MYLKKYNDIVLRAYAVKNSTVGIRFACISIEL